MVCACALGIVALAGSPASAQYVSGTYTFTIDDPTVCGGETFAVSGQITIDAAERSRAAGDPTIVDISFDGQPLGSLPVQDDLSYRGTFTTPDVAAGAHTLSADYLGSDVDLTVTVLAGGSCDGVIGTVTVPVTGTGALARTGSSSVDTLVKVGGGLVLAGAAVALVSTKRRRRLA